VRIEKNRGHYQYTDNFSGRNRKMQKHANVQEKLNKNMNGMKRRQRKRMKYAMYGFSMFL
jgi:hypothetical protein